MRWAIFAVLLVLFAAKSLVFSWENSSTESYSGTGELPQLIIEARVYLKQGYFVVSHLGHNCWALQRIFRYFEESLLHCPGLDDSLVSRKRESERVFPWVFVAGTIFRHFICSSWGMVLESICSIFSSAFCLLSASRIDILTASELEHLLKMRPWIQKQKRPLCQWKNQRNIGWLLRVELSESNFASQVLKRKLDAFRLGPLCYKMGWRPFTRKLPEFKFWWSGARATAIALAWGPGMTLHVLTRWYIRCWSCKCVVCL